MSHTHILGEIDADRNIISCATCYAVIGNLNEVTINGSA